MKSKHVLAAAICIGLGLGFSGGLSHAAGMTAKKTHPAAVMSHKAVTGIQTELQVLGYYHGRITGRMDRATRKAVKVFQAEHKLKVDGIPGKRTQRALEEAVRARKDQKKGGTR